MLERFSFRRMVRQVKCAVGGHLMLAPKEKLPTIFVSVASALVS
jgi:hypothetical protein